MMSYPQPIAGHNIARIKCLQIHAFATMRVVRSVWWLVLTVTIGGILSWIYQFLAGLFP